VIVAGSTFSSLVPYDRPKLDLCQKCLKEHNEIATRHRALIKKEQTEFLKS
jgi:hypothetical protein